MQLPQGQTEIIQKVREALNKHEAKLADINHKVREID